MADPRLAAIRAQAAAYPDGDLAYALAQHDAAQASAETLLSILDAMSRRLTPAEGATVAREIAVCGPRSKPRKTWPTCARKPAR